MLKFKKSSLRLLSLIICIMLSVPAPAAFAVNGQEMAEDLDNYFIPAFPIVYGEIIDSLPAEGLAGVSSVLKGVEIFDYIYKIGKIGDSLASGTADMDTALDSATVAANLAIKFMADGATKKILIAGVGVGTLPLTALITSIDIARSSSKAVAQSKIALDLERLYYSVEANPVLRDRNRKLGTGNPIKTDAAAVEHLFRKCLREQSWSALFKTYVTTELGQDWPEPSLWDRLTVDNDFLEEAAILAEKNRLKSHITSLLLELNKVAQKQEARVVVAKQSQAIRAMAGKISPEELRKALSLYQTALKELPDIQKYVESLPEKIRQYEETGKKATAVELEKMRVEKLPKDMKEIVTCMSYVKYLPTRGSHSSMRQSLLEKLKNSYTTLFNLKNNVSIDMINTRLEEEVKALTVQGQLFEFTRYPCPKFFEDYLPAIEADVKAGRPPEALAKIYEEIEETRKTLSDSYDKDYKANEKIYNEKIHEFDDKINEINEKIKDVKNRIATTSETSTLNRLRETLNTLEQTLNGLKVERDKLMAKFNVYRTMFQDTATIDLSQCEKIIDEINQYIGAYTNKFQNIQSYLKECYKNALSIHREFANSHSGSRLSEGFLSEEEIDEIKDILAKNTGSVYAYLDLDFLKDLVQLQPDMAMSASFQKILDDLTEAINHTLKQVAESKVTVIRDWSLWTISRLQYMEDSKSTNDINTVIDSVDKALAEFHSVDPDDISKSYKAEYDENIRMLEIIKEGMDSYKKLKPLAGGLASQLEAYIAQADGVNARVEEDRIYLTNVYLQFVNAKDHLKYSLANAMAKSLSAKRNAETFPTGISGRTIKDELENAGILNFSSKRSLGIEALFKEPFIDISTDSGTVSIRPEHLNNVLSGINALPVDSYENYQPAYAALKEKEGIEGIIFSMTDSETKFVNFFSFDSSMQKTAEKIIKKLKEKKERISAVVTKAGEENALFTVLKNKIDHLIKFSNDQIAMGNFSSVMVLGTQADDLKIEYEELDKTDKKIDEAFKELAALIALAKEKYIDEQNRLNTDIDKGLEVIKDFYGDFKKAYESMDDYQVMNLIDEDWEAGDGTTLTDLEMNLSRTFRTFDEIQYSISNLKISPLPQDTYMVTYDIKITSRMFSRNLKHEEKSSVSEEVGIDDKGRVKIIRTLNGRFWQE